MDVYIELMRKYKYIIIGVVLFIVLLALWSNIFRVTKTNLTSNTLPTWANEIIIDYNYPIDSYTFSFEPAIEAASSKKGKKISIVIQEKLKKDQKYTLKVDAKSSFQSSHFEKSFTVVEVITTKEDDMVRNTQLQEEYTRRYQDINIINHNDYLAPYRMMYDYDDTSTVGKRAKVVVKNSDPKGRLEAMKWLRLNGIDPTSLDIRFEGYINPLTGDSI